MNKGVHEFGRISRKHLMNLLIIVPLLLAALFAYQAGNTFEQTAGASRIHASVKYTASVNVGKMNSTTKLFLPENVLLVAYLHSLLLLFRRSTTLFALRTSVPQRMRDLLMTPIKFTSHFVGCSSHSVYL
ncbi:hypothetical protein [Paenibacillus sp. LHD-38]|uniref:hypothetical protein n=1 Tax=Paenibacillus sp. LHD-38 TaxID=3072143 RepID=UPI0028108559|nr:hypothetical protein [Paenibacillus sp. LHD-38]MDQ8736122.1 hypothetical protein [Paenibacillus sp. LHD-38]